MLVPVNWLKKYVNIDDIEIKTLEERLIMSGSNTETVEAVAGQINKIVVGKCLSREKHPDADKLLVLQVDIGEEEPIQIVTAAQNVYPDNYIPVALHKSTLHDGTKIKKGKLRGVVSNGMFCSLEEVGFEKKVIQKEYADGIYILQGTPELGADIKDVLDLNDHIIEFEITPNRPDCLSILGMARETAATFDRELTMPDTSIENEVDDVNDYAKIEIQDADLCPRFGARVVKNVKIGPSPTWLQLAVMKAGMRPVNNIVDITNFVLLEYGQPIHAYDLETLEGRKLIARRAVADEILVTLDEEERKLTEDMLVIADEKQAVGLAGIMGGADTEIKDDTKTILIEVANFFKSNIRKTSRDLALRSEASSRFEKGVSPEYIPEVLDRVCHLIEKIGAGTVVKGMIDVYPQPKEAKEILVRPERVTGLLGVDLSTDEITAILNKLQIKTEMKDGKIACLPPAFRLDLIEEIDFVEEVARIYGYDVIEATLPADSEWGAKTNGQIIEDIAKDALCEVGMNEILTYSFVSPSQYDKLCLPVDSMLRNAVMLKNPLGEEYSTMRTTLNANMLEVLSKNYNRSVESAVAFEIGNLFFPREMPVENLPIEKKQLCLGAYGPGEDFFSLKGRVDELLSVLGIKGVAYHKESNHPTYHPGRCATLVWGNHILGTLGEVHPKVLENYSIDTKTYLADIDFNILLQLTRLDRTYTPLPKYPASTRGIALLVEKTVESGKIMSVIEENGTEILESVKLFDVYEGEQIEAGYKSMAYALSFRSLERTLTDDEVNAVYDKILEALKSETGAELR
ncbi:phenylalanine--tRNA ligase subunit beta [Fusibacter sp. JL216-2]|uniref:phenylalanine--tRNA ligase subunit beta n=1 Tax=Fusibacter sp. JL216-2 TaxID=3071453 RepID=UPI003D35804D